MHDNPVSSVSARKWLAKNYSVLLCCDVNNRVERCGCVADSDATASSDSEGEAPREREPGKK